MSLLRNLELLCKFLNTSCDEIEVVIGGSMIVITD
jgi:hypothetical protein